MQGTITPHNNVGGLKAYGLSMIDLRQDRDPEDFDLDIEIGGEMRLTPAADVSCISDDEDGGPSAAAVVNPVADPVALATILDCVQTTLAGLSLATKKETDALCFEVIHSMHDILRRSDTKIKEPQRCGRGPQSAAGRRTSGPVLPATSVASEHFWAAVPVGRPKSNLPHRTTMTPIDVLAQRLEAEPRSVVAVVDAASTGTLTSSPRYSNPSPRYSNSLSQVL